LVALEIPSALALRISNFDLCHRLPLRKTQIVKPSASAPQIILAHSPAHLDAIRELFTEYSRSLNIDLCFQGFAQELAELPGRYAPPDGRLFLMVEGGINTGCVGLRKISYGTCEMKRLYLRPAFRRKGAGRLLANASIEAAREIGYQRMRLDTLPSMQEAIGLYRSLCFCEVEPYYDNAGAIFMELSLNVH
jgi:ribosomal protein S18 acetylase RimI-like enzyme